MVDGVVARYPAVGWRGEMGALIKRYLEVRGRFIGLVADPGQGTNLSGWLNRLENLRREVGA